MDIRKIKEVEIKSVLDFIWTVFLKFKDKDCLDVGIAAFKKHIDYDSNLELFFNKRLCFYGCFIDKHLAGAISVRDGNHICMLYVDSKFQHRGIATQLINTIVENIRLNTTFSYITVNSSHYAIDFYHKIGFVDQGEEQMIDEIRFTPMCFPISFPQ